MEKRFKEGDIVCHFKREMLSEAEQLTPKHLYVIIAFAKHTETDELCVVYKALYDDGMTFVRPYDMFISEVDREKYPNVKQKYRLEVYNGPICNEQKNMCFEINEVNKNEI